MSAGVILALKFIEPNDKKFSAYIDYIDREIAVRNNKFSEYNALTSNTHIQQDNWTDYNEYINYMNNPQKTDELFTATHDGLTTTQKQNLKTIFETAQTNNSIMWQGVISFDTKWLTEMGLYDPEYNTLNVSTVKAATRAATNKLLNKEKLDNSAQWCAAIHYNTDNIHVHFAIVEPFPTRKQKIINNKPVFVGRVKQSSIDQAKSRAVNMLIKNKDLNLKINKIIRDKIIAQAQNKSIVTDKRFRDELLSIYNQLPPNRKLWNYHSTALQPLIPQLDKLSEYYLNTYHSKDMIKLNSYLEKQEQLYKDSYGEKYVNNFAQNKINDLYYRFGNTILKELREYDKKRKEELYRHYNNSNFKFSSQEYVKGVSLSTLTYSLQKLSRNLRNEKEHFMAQIAYEELQNQIAQEHSN